MRKATFPLETPLARQRAVKAVEEASPDLVVTIGPQPRKRRQESMFWAKNNLLAKSFEWSGRLWSQEAWADFFYAAWCHERRMSAEFMPGMFGVPVRIGRHTSSLSDEEYGEMLTLQDVFMAENGIEEEAA